MRTIRMEWWQQGISGRENGRRAGTRGDRTGAEKIFTDGRGGANLQRGVPGRNGGTDGGRRKW